MNNRNEQIKKVLSDEAFVKTLLEAENEEAVQKMLADKGVEMSLTEIELMGEMLDANAKGILNMEAVEKFANGGELSEEELEEAAGGNWFTNLFYTTKEVIDSGWDRITTVYDNTTGTPNPQPGILEMTKNSTITKRVLSAGKIAGGIAVGVAAIAGLGYGVYDAVRRRW